MTSKPGHHQTAIQTLSTSAGLAPAKVIVLDALRKQRNLSAFRHACAFALAPR
jgi:hypothetical protein